jgi:hypothetical protein
MKFSEIIYQNCSTPVEVQGRAHLKKRRYFIPNSKRKCSESGRLCDIIYVPIPEFPTYKINKDGIVINKDGIEMKQVFGKVVLYQDSKHHTRSAKKLVKTIFPILGFSLLSSVT